MIYIDAEHLSDGLYNIKDGHIFKYKPKGGTVRVYKMEHRPQGEWLLSDLQSQADNDNGNYTYVCTNCNHTDIHAKTQEVPYCWWCGARMKGASDAV